jgi:hypothetical protein
LGARSPLIDAATKSQIARWPDFESLTYTVPRRGSTATLPLSGMARPVGEPVTTRVSAAPFGTVETPSQASSAAWVKVTPDDVHSSSCGSVIASGVALTSADGAVSPEASSAVTTM